MQVTFDIDSLRSRYPHLSDISDATLEACFEDACVMYGNTDSTSLFAYDPDDGVYSRRIFLYAVTCHLATLQQWAANGQPGRVASASQGSVSTSFDLLKTNRDTADWWYQTPCGSMAWQLLKGKLRGGRVYVFPHRHPFG